MSIPRMTAIFETLAPVSVNPVAQASVDAYADVAGSKIDSAGKTRVVYVITNSGADSISWKVLASNDDTTYVEVEAEATLAAAATASWVASAVETSYRYFKVQVKSTVGSTPGEATVSGYAKM